MRSYVLVLCLILHSCASTLAQPEQVEQPKIPDQENPHLPRRTMSIFIPLDGNVFSKGLLGRMSPLFRIMNEHECHAKHWKIVLRIPVLLSEPPYKILKAAACGLTIPAQPNLRPPIGSVHLTLDNCMFEAQTKFFASLPPPMQWGDGAFLEVSCE